MTQASTKSVAGLLLVSDGKGHWATADGRSGVQREYGLTTCDGPHPIRLSPSVRSTILAQTAAYPYEASWAAIRGAKGYRCPGNAEHPYPIWTVWHDGWFIEDGGIFPTMREALDRLAEVAALVAARV